MSVPEGIGPIESLAPSPGPGRARILGAPQVIRLTGRTAGILGQMAVDARKARKDYNDAPVSDDPVGAQAGQQVVSNPAAAVP